MNVVRIRMLATREGRLKGTIHEVPEDVAKRHFAMAEAVADKPGPEDARSRGHADAETATEKTPVAKKKKTKKKAKSKK